MAETSPVGHAGPPPSFQKEGSAAAGAREAHGTPGAQGVSPPFRCDKRQRVFPPSPNTGALLAHPCLVDATSYNSASCSSNNSKSNSNGTSNNTSNSNSNVSGCSASNSSCNSGGATAHSSSSSRSASASSSGPEGVPLSSGWGPGKERGKRHRLHFADTPQASQPPLRSNPFLNPPIYRPPFQNSPLQTAPLQNPDLHNPPLQLQTAHALAFARTPEAQQLCTSCAPVACNSPALTHSAQAEPAAAAALAASAPGPPASALGPCGVPLVHPRSPSAGSSSRAPPSGALGVPLVHPGPPPLLALLPPPSIPLHLPSLGTRPTPPAPPLYPGTPAAHSGHLPVHPPLVHQGQPISGQPVVYQDRLSGADPWACRGHASGCQGQRLEPQAAAPLPLPVPGSPTPVHPVPPSPCTVTQGPLTVTREPRAGADAATLPLAFPHRYQPNEDAPATSQQQHTVTGAQTVRGQVYSVTHPVVFPERFQPREDALGASQLECRAVLGSGHFGTVRRYCSRATGKEYAVKSVDKSRPGNTAGLREQELRQEVSVMAALQAGGGHPNVTVLHSVVEDMRSVHLLLELCEGGDLFDYLTRTRSQETSDSGDACASPVQSAEQGRAVQEGARQEGGVEGSVGADQGARQVQGRAGGGRPEGERMESEYARKRGVASAEEGRTGEGRGGEGRRVGATVRLSEAQAACIFRDIVSAVAFCHSHRVLHRDIKPENILLCSRPQGVASEQARQGLALQQQQQQQQQQKEEEGQEGKQEQRRKEPRQQERRQLLEAGTPAVGSSKSNNSNRRSTSGPNSSNTSSPESLGACGQPLPLLCPLQSDAHTQAQTTPSRPRYATGVPQPPPPIPGHSPPCSAPHPGSSPFSTPMAHPRVTPHKLSPPQHQTPPHSDSAQGGPQAYGTPLAHHQAGTPFQSSGTLEGQAPGTPAVHQQARNPPPPLGRSPGGQAWGPCPAGPCLRPLPGPAPNAPLRFSPLNPTGGMVPAAQGYTPGTPVSASACRQGASASGAGFAPAWMGPGCTPGQHIMRLMGIKPLSLGDSLAGAAYSGSQAGAAYSDSPAAASGAPHLHLRLPPYVPSFPCTVSREAPRVEPPPYNPSSLTFLREAPTVHPPPHDPSFPWTVKIADFGLAVQLPPGGMARGAIGSPLYMAPEVVTGEYSFPADVWSLGVVLHVLLVGTLPFAGASDREVLASVRAAQRAARDGYTDGFPSLSDSKWGSVSAGAKGLVRALLVPYPEGRPTAAQVLADPWLKGHAQGGRIVRRLLKTSEHAVV